MWLLSLLSSTLFVVPVVITGLTYFGADHQRILECGFHCGTPGNASDPFQPGGGGGPNLTDKTYCQKSYAVTPPPGRYAFNPNQWGDPDDTGGLCLNFTNSGLGGPADYAAGWTATWHYPVGTVDLPVHAYPNANLRLPDVLPVQLSNMSGLTIDVAWAYDAGSAANSITNYDAVAEAEINANVCVDMFLAPNTTDATSTTESAYEVMVWLGRFGAATDPLGWLNGTQDTRVINGTSFNLYVGANSLGQLAFTWLADQNTTEFTGDIGPLLTDLSGDGGPTGTDYLGYIAFGSETLHANGNATFYVPKLEMDVLTG